MPNGNTLKEGLIKDAYELIIKEMQTVISLAYILTVGIGMLFNYQLYAEFGINIFDYSDVFDFLLAPFADYKILLFSIVSMFFSFCLVRLDIVWQKKYPTSYSRSTFGWDKKSWFSTFRYSAFAFGFIVYLYVAADMYGQISKNLILESKPIEITYVDNETKSGILIGKTQDVIFMWKEGEVDVIPVTATVKKIALPKN